MMWYFGFRLPLPHRKFLEIDSIQSRFGSLWLGISFYNFFLYNTTRNKRGRAGKLQNHPHFISIRLCVLVAYFLFFHLFFFTSHSFFYRPFSFVHWIMPFLFRRTITIITVDSFSSNLEQPYTIVVNRRKHFKWIYFLKLIFMCAENKMKQFHTGFICLQIISRLNSFMYRRMYDVYL